MDKSFTVEETAIGTAALLNSLLAGLFARKVLSKRDCNLIFDQTIEYVRNIDPGAAEFVESVQDLNAHLR